MSKDPEELAVSLKKGANLTWKMVLRANYFLLILCHMLHQTESEGLGNTLNQSCTNLGHETSFIAQRKEGLSKKIVLP